MTENIPLIKYIYTALMAMIPVVELRGAIPYGISQGCETLPTYICAVLGNLFPVPFIVVYVRKIFALLRTKIPFTDRLITWLEKRGEGRGEIVRRWRFLGIVILVAIPFPGTGAWTGALVAALLDVRLKHALPAAFLGLLIAGAIVLLPSVHLLG